MTTSLSQFFLLGSGTPLPAHPSRPTLAQAGTTAHRAQDLNSFCPWSRHMHFISLHTPPRTACMHFALLCALCTEVLFPFNQLASGRLHLLHLKGNGCKALGSTACQASARLLRCLRFRLLAASAAGCCCCCCFACLPSWSSLPNSTSL